MPLPVRLLSLTAAALLLTACGGMGARGDDAAAGFRLDGKAAVVSDACVLRDDAGQQYLLRDLSGRAGVALADGARGTLEAYGFSVDATRTPFACGLAPERLRGVSLLAQDGGQALRNGVQDLIVLPAARKDYLLASAYRRLLHLAVGEDEAEVAWGAQGRIGNQLSEAEAQLIMADTGAPYVWIITNGGLSAGGSKGGFFSNMIRGDAKTGPYAADTLEKVAALIDLRTRDFRWRHADLVSPANPMDPELYQPVWAGELLADALPYGGKAPESAPLIAQQAPAPAVAPGGKPSTKAPAAKDIPVMTPPVADAMTRRGPYIVANTPLLGRPQRGSPIIAPLPAGLGVTVEREIPTLNGGYWAYIRTPLGNGWVQSNAMAIR